MIGKIIQSVVYLKYASKELLEIYPEISESLLELAQSLISEQNINEIQIKEFQNLVEETIKNEKELQ